MPNELTNPNNVVTEERLAQFYQQILPYLGGASHLCIGGGYAPIGAILPFMGTIVPGGFLACDGSVYNIVDYPALADFIDTQFGSIDFFGGDGLVTFAVPDLRGEFLRGTGTNSHTDQGSGEDVGVHQDATAIPKITTGTTGTTVNRGKNITNDNIDSGIGSSNTGYYNGSPSSTSVVGDDQKITLRPTNTSVLYCIKAELDNTYSTTEKIVGTWIDGKPIWQKTVNNVNLSPTWNGQYYAYAYTSILIPDVENIINSVGIGEGKCVSIDTIIDSQNSRWQICGNEVATLSNTHTYVFEYTKTSS